MQEKRRKEIRCYRIRAGLLWTGIVFTITVMSIMCFWEKIFERWQGNQEQIEVSYNKLQSELRDISCCYLCGSSNMSLIDYFYKSDTLGLISLNDWYVLDFKVRNYDEQGMAIFSKGHETIWGNTGEIRYMSEGFPSNGKAAIEVTLPENYDLDITVIKQHLYQTCLDKVTKTLKGKREQKNTIPLCLVDFETLEIYSLQDWHMGCFIRDYWVEISFDENKVRVEIFLSKCIS